MTADRQKVNDPEQIRQIVERLFVRVPVTLMEKAGESPVSLLKYENQLIEISHDRPASNARILGVRQNDQLLYLECRVVQTNSSGNELVQPVCLHLHRQVRREPRTEVPENATAPVIKSFISIGMFSENLTQSNNTRDMLVKIYNDRIRKLFPEAGIVLRKTVRMDARMRLMNQNAKSIFAPSRSDPTVWHDLPDESGARLVTFQEYEEIRNYDKLSENIVSEICVPLLYRDYYLYGYIQVLSDKELTAKQFMSIVTAGQTLEQEFEKRGCLPENKERCPILDINRSGVGLLHPPNSPVLKNFMAGQQVIFDMEFPGGSRDTLRGIIRNIRPLEKAYRIGIQFDESAQQSERLNAYLATQPA
ncbi:MAG: PilZ domain-containing protein [Leptospirales bacterium]|nr:PilZ domain-containing protein [Leptospirales bacterium]